MNTWQASEKLAINCFFNALYREWPQGMTLQQTPARLECELGLFDRIVLPIEYVSLCGRHLFEGGIYLEKNGIKRQLGFLDAVPLLLDRLKDEKNITPTSLNEFLQRLDESVKNTHLCLESRSEELQQIYQNLSNLIQSEQNLLVGHSVHPLPKSRSGMNEDEVMLYAPEFSKGFALHWFAVAAQALDCDSVAEKNFAELTLQLAQQDPLISSDFLAKVEPGMTLLPAHPWQVKVWLEDLEIQKLIQHGLLIDLGQQGSLWRATSSMRSIYAEHASWMLKFSLSVKLTNSIRHLLPKEVQRGKEVFQVLERTSAGKQFRKRCSSFEILGEPAHGALKSIAGEILPQTMLAFRENPFQGAAAENIELLATLTQDNPQGESRIIQLIRRLAIQHNSNYAQTARQWLNRFYQHLITPLLIGQSEFGFLFGAHQQNLLLDLSEGFPSRGWFRDCQGSGFTKLAQKLLPQISAGEYDEHYVASELGVQLFGYYLVINSCFGVISAIAAARDDQGELQIEEARLLADFRQQLIGLRESQVADPSCLDYLLESSELSAKGNFLCCLQTINENTLDNPLSIYHPMKNPLCDPAVLRQDYSVNQSVDQEVML